MTLKEKRSQRRKGWVTQRGAAKMCRMVQCGTFVNRLNKFGVRTMEFQSNNGSMATLYSVEDIKNMLVHHKPKPVGRKRRQHRIGSVCLEPHTPNFIPSSEKLCAKCKKSKPVASYTIRRASKDGLHVWCRECQAEYDRSRNRSGKHQPSIARRTNVGVLNEKRAELRGYGYVPCSEVSKILGMANGNGLKALMRREGIRTMILEMSPGRYVPWYKVDDVNALKERRIKEAAEWEAKYEAAKAIPVDPVVERKVESLLETASPGSAVDTCVKKLEDVASDLLDAISNLRAALKY
jgi:hypothetical protein